MEACRSAISFIQSYSTSKKVTNEIMTIPSPNNDCYDMEHERRGYAIIFNNILPNTDRNRIKDTLEKLEFEVLIYDNTNYEEMIEIVNDVPKLDHINVACFVMVVITHGTAKGLRANDVTFSPNELWEPFNAIKCPTLNGKPKLFFIDACRGGKHDKGVTVQFDNNNMQPMEMGKIPNMADFLIMYSTQQGDRGYARTDIGSWFIHALCVEIEKRYKHLDLLSILTFVNRRIAYDYEGTGDAEHRGSKQMSSIVSNLTKFLYLY